MSKLYVFAIGGTGSRVLRSLTMLLAAGVDCDVDTIVPIVIDRDKGNGDFTRTNDLIQGYISVNRVAPKRNLDQNILNRFFNTKIKLLGDNLLLKLDDETRKFEDFIGINTQSKENKALCQMLFSKNTLSMDTEFGFRGNPNIGSVVLNQFDDKDIFKAFASDFQSGDKIFIISSIFGGTGASGFPLLLKVLQTPNLKDAQGNVLQNWGLINNAPLGAISVLPYFNVNKKDNVDSDTFNDKTRAALAYYETLNGKLDTHYYIADTRRKVYEYAEGGEKQKNNSHFVELAAALSIIDFVNNDRRNENFKKDGDGKRKTTYKEFGINSNEQEISFDNLAVETQKLIVNPLSRFMLFAKYMGYTIKSEIVDGKEKFFAERVPEYDIFDKENKYQPYAIGRFDKDFRNRIANLEFIQRQYIEWLHEMTQQERKFIPFNLSTNDAFNFVNGKVSIFTKGRFDFAYKGWARVDDKLNREINKVNKSLNNEEKFMELFYRVTENLINQTNPTPGNNKDKYIFRLQNAQDCGLLNTIEHWGTSDLYGEKQRNAIQSSNEKSESQPTSIPSPFARIALVKTAFAEVAQHGDKALYAYQKIVSDCLDVGEIFFTFDKWVDKIEIITWKYGSRENSTVLEDNSDLKKLEKSHQILYKTLRTFLDNDALEYNFNKMKCIYILKYKETGEMIGATSPCTLFFSSANNYSHVNIQLNSQRKAFEGIVPLHQRNWEFQRYLYSWVVQYNENKNINGRSISLFNEFLKYLEAQKKLINRTAEIDALTTVDTNLYSAFRAPDVEILGKPLHKINEIHPDMWSADDILESVIFRVNYKINKESFFDGNLPDKSDKFFILPIKDRFFTKYSINDLKKFIKINYSGDVSEVEVNINNQDKPIKKKYSKSENTLIDLNFYFDCGIFPNAKFKDEALADYRFGLLCDFKVKDKFNADFVKIGTNIDPINKRLTVRNEKHGNNPQLKTFSLRRSNFDYIKISYNNISGIIIPNFKIAEGSSRFTFAVDFGTTNTHIEYKKDNELDSKPFDVLYNDRQVHYLHGGEDFLKRYFDEEYIPACTDEEFKFPMRTALSYGENTNWLDVQPFEKASFRVLYEKRLDFEYNETETNIKWSDQKDYQSKVRVCIESIVYLLRNKVMLNNGSLKDTKIIWFYPVSMERRRFENLKRVWSEAYRKYFGGEESNLVSITESIAPFEYYIKDGDTSNLVTIDIGGGTTDVVVANDGKADYITSFRFAANAIFGDGYVENNRIKNGIVRQFCESIRNDLRSEIGNEDHVFEIFDDMHNNRRSDDYASFLISLKHNKDLREKFVNLADKANLHDKLLNDDTQTITFIFFYSAVIWHVAKLMKALNVKMPDKIVFSGNGSRVIEYISADDSTLNDYTKLIYEKVFQEKHPKNGITILRLKDNPKAATCKGGFYLSYPFDYQTILEKKVVLHSNGTNQVIRCISPNKYDLYESINDDYLSKTVQEVKEFIEFVLANLSFFRVRGYRLNDDSIKIAKNICTKRLDIYAKKGWQLKKNDVAEDEVINESIFFYPLVGMLKDLADAIRDKNVFKE